MKYLIYVLFFFILSSCNVSNKLYNDSINSNKDSVIVFIDSSYIEDVVDSVYIKKDIYLEVGANVEEVGAKEVDVEANKEKHQIDDRIKIPNKITDNAEVVDKVKDGVEKIGEGIIAYSIPKEMIVGKYYSVKLRISKDANKSKLILGDREIPINDVSVSSKITIESIRVESVMSAQLISEEVSFKIESKSTEFQNIEDNGYTEWQWRITPLRGGSNFLKLLVKVRVKNEGGEFYKDIIIFDKKVDIKSNALFSFKTWLSNYWQWIISTIIIPFIVWFYRKKSEEKKKRRK
jgi:hypothetical protein